MIKNASFILDEEALEKLGKTFSCLEEFVNSQHYISLQGVPEQAMSPFIECVYDLFGQWRTGSRANQFPQTLEEFERYIDDATAPLEAPNSVTQAEAIEVLQDIEQKLEGLIHIFGAPGTGFSIIEKDNGMLSLWDHKLADKHGLTGNEESFLKGEIEE